MGLFDKVKNAIQETGIGESAKKAFQNIASDLKTASSRPTKTTNVETVSASQTVEYVTVYDFELNEVSDGNYEIAKFVGFEETNMEIPAQINGKNILGIADSVFEGMQTFARIKISEGIRYIGTNTFYKCPELVSVELPETLEKMGDYCFAETPITSVRIPNGVTHVGEGCFEKCSELVSAILPEDMEIIPVAMFNQCEKLSEIRFPRNVSVVKKNAFYNDCSLLLKALPESCAVVEENAFSSCFADPDGVSKPVEEFRLPSGLISIGEGALGGLNCEKLVIPASVKEIGEKAFCYIGAGWSGTRVVFEDGCTAKLPKGLFFNEIDSSGVASISIPASITEIENIFEGEGDRISVVTVRDEYGRVVYDEYGRSVTEDKIVKAISRIPEELIIYCDPGSAAMEYARENGIKCERRV